MLFHIWQFNIWAEWARKETGIACELDVREPLV